MPIVTSDTPEPNGWKYGIGQGGWGTGQQTFYGEQQTYRSVPPPTPMQADRYVSIADNAVH